ncbi:hypothetical protein HAN_2g233 (nucleomorph) [Hemiselmis andersenii]|uniref:General transcription and DNA repair factor IIH subunit TFB5 n=1 Tax=Hemiselmis andersenii TaxID=464988 RepID=A9BKQ4_HEMAN|nr:hypothetical protein HAN_2g233 [Hemiselmis andersenii]ABW98059.1 hypothetical protein HAN_2g233 [Hemiselmis andersenii]
MKKIIKGNLVKGDNLVIKFILRLNFQLENINFLIYILGSDQILIKDWAKKIVIYALNKLYRKNLF